LKTSLYPGNCVPKAIKFWLAPLICGLRGQNKEKAAGATLAASFNGAGVSRPAGPHIRDLPDDLSISTSFPGVSSNGVYAGFRGVNLMRPVDRPLSWTFSA
jgi:hypothetical protein